MYRPMLKAIDTKAPKISVMGDFGELQQLA
jgi:hypothetical protein